MKNKNFLIFFFLLLSLGGFYFLFSFKQEKKLASKEGEFFSQTRSPNSQGNEIQLDVKKYKLSNGLTVVLHESDNPFVMTMLCFRVGAINEHPGITGLAHFFEHLMFKETENYPAVLDKFMPLYGGSNNAYTAADRTCYHNKFLNTPLAKDVGEHLLPILNPNKGKTKKEKKQYKKYDKNLKKAKFEDNTPLKTILYLESERMSYLNLNSEMIDGKPQDKNDNGERGVIQAEKIQRASNLQSKLWIENTKAHYKAGTPYSWEVIGTDEDIAGVKLEDFKKFYRRYYSPNNAILTVVGNFKASRAEKWINEFFSSKKSQDIPSLEKISWAERPQKNISREKVSSPLMTISYGIPAIRDTRNITLDVLSGILTRGKDSIFYKKFIEEEKLVSSVSAYPYASESSGLFYFQFTLLPGKNPETVEKIFYEEIEKIKTKPFSRDKINKVLTQLKTDKVFSLTSLSRKASILTLYEFYYNDYNKFFTELKEYEEVTPQDILNVSKEFFKKDNKVVSVFLPKK